MNSLEEDLSQYLETHKKPKIHISEIKKCITASEKEIKNALLRISSEDPTIGNFEYSTGWLEREIRVVSPESLKYKKIFALVLLGFGLGVLFFVPIFGIYIGFLLVCLAINYLMKLYHYEEVQRKTSQSEALRAAMAANLAISGPFHKV
ncbi:MAG: hypothetical protein ACFFDI_09430 [Promethearchaeota archaeon]